MEILFPRPERKRLSAIKLAVELCTGVPPCYIRDEVYIRSISPTGIQKAQYNKLELVYYSSILRV